MATKMIQAVFVFFSGMKIITDPLTGRQKFGGDAKIDFNKLLDLYFDPFKWVAIIEKSPNLKILTIP